MADVNRIDDTSGDTTHQGTDSADIFKFGPGYANSDTITGFTNGTDLIDLTRFQGITRFEDLTVTSDDNGVTIDLTGHGGGTILLSGFSIDNVDATDFVFSTLDGGGTSGDDTLQADDDGDRVDGGAGDDTITGGGGSDILIGGAGADTIYGGAEADGLAGHEGDDELYGGAGSDFLEGGEGADTIYGGSGDDEMYGDGGADTFVFDSGHGNDTLYDFTSGEDRIDLTGFTGITAFDGLSITSGDGGVTIDLTGQGGGTIFLDGVTLADLDADDFIFSTEGADTFSDGWVYGTEGDDRIVDLTAGADKYDGLGGSDYIRGLGGDDHIRGGEGDDTLIGGDYNGDDRDTLEGGAGDDTLSGGGGDDTLLWRSRRR